MTAPEPLFLPPRITVVAPAPSLLQALSQGGKIEDYARYRLQQYAHTLALSPGFDHLLALQATRDVQPYAHQIETVRRVIRQFRGRALLCDEVGLGKTIEAGLILLEYLLRGLVRKVLILTPPSLTTQWQEEMLHKFSLDFVLSDAPGFNSSTTSGWVRFDRVIASFHTAKLAPHSEVIGSIDYDLVIVDEAHHLKSHTTRLFHFINTLQKKYMLLLTATPVQNTIDELYHLIHILKPGLLDTMKTFKRTFITRGDPLTPKNHEALREILRDVMIRNRRSQTEVRFTQRHARTIRLPLSQAEASLYERVTAFVRREHPRVSPDARRSVNTLVLQILQAEVGSSIPAVLPTLDRMCQNEHNSPAQREELTRLSEDARRIREQTKTEALLQVLQALDDKALVFTQFRATQEHLLRTLHTQGIAVSAFHGAMRRAEKERHIQEFRERTRVLICTESGGEGRNLQFCNTIINYDLPWNPMRIEQRIGRISRVGQTRDVHIITLAAMGTIESYILDLLDAKIHMFELVIGEMDMILGRLDDPRPFHEIILDIWVSARTEPELHQQFDALGEQLVAARQSYERVRETDEQLFGDHFHARGEAPSDD